MIVRHESEKTVNYATMEADELYDYLIEWQFPYLQQCLSDLNLYLNTIVKNDAGMHLGAGEMIPYFEELEDMTDQCLAKDQYIFFPYVLKLTEAKKNKNDLFIEDNLFKNTEDVFKEERKKITGIITKLLKISSDYVPSVNSSTALKLFHDKLLYFEKNIYHYFFIKEGVLFDKVIALEKELDSYVTNT